MIPPMIIADLKGLATPINDLQLLPGNPRRGDVDAVRRSLLTFGQRKPIVARRDDKVVIAGNHTLQAARLLGWTEIAVVWVDDDETTSKAFALADNRTSDLGTYDETALAELIGQVGSIDPELLQASGWDRQSVQDLLDGMQTQPKHIDDPDWVPEKVQHITKPGDMWELGPHRVICGDSTKDDTYRQLLDGAKADCIFTDPPYNVNVHGRTKDKLTITNDDMSDEQFTKFLAGSFKAMSNNAKPGAAIYVCHSATGATTFIEEFMKAGFLLKQVIVWVKQTFVLSRSDYNWQHEPILYGWKEGAAHTWLGPFNNSTVLDYETDFEQLSKQDLVSILNEIRSISNVVREDKPARSEEHPSMKPVNLIARLVVNNTRPNNMILDPFGGSGTTLVAAHQLGRTARLIEIDPKYCDVICTRWQKISGLRPVNAKTRKHHDFKPQHG
jgi:DNA modification methylase